MSPDPKVNILLVDDQQENLLALEAVLEDLGENLVRARSGAEALRRMLEAEFAVVLLDVQMPDMDGFETARLIRERDRSRTTPIIFLTAINTSEAHVYRGYGLGAVDYLFKPFVPEALKAKVAAFVAICRQARQLQEEIERRRRVEEEVRRLNADLERRVGERTAELRASNQELAAAARHKDQFLSMLAHELRNPIGALSNALHVLETARPDTPPYRRAREIALRQLRHQTRMVDDLLDVSRINRGKIQLREEPLDFVSLVADAVEDYRSVLQQAGLSLRFEAGLSDGKRPVLVRGDATRLVQVLSNLLDNAMKFTPRGGSVLLRVTPDWEAHTVELCVSDTGVGISPEVLPDVFEPFRQADSSLDRTRGGLGLGLALVRGLIELHGGEVAVRSEGLERGTEFAVRLPLLTAEDTALRRGLSRNGSLPREVGSYSPAQRRVLVVEDNRDAAESLRDLLEMEGCQVELAFTGPSGLAAARRFHPEVVLCDIGLPGMDGYGVAEALRADPHTASVKLVAVTGYGQEEDRRRAMDAGFDIHLVKPVDPHHLQQVLAPRSLRKRTRRKAKATNPPAG